MTGTAKVLTGLMERRELEMALAELGEITDLERLTARAREIAQRGRAVVPVLLSMLDTDDPQLRGGLGHVAANLPREQIVPALRALAQSPERSDRARLSALTILDRFLHEPIDESLLVAIRNPDQVALQSLGELVRAMERSPIAVLEYLSQLSEQPAEVAGMIINAIPQMPPSPHLVTLLYMFAQDVDPIRARQALEQLSRTRSPEAHRALACLSIALPPSLAPLAERGLRKMRMSGVPQPPPTHQGWRGLLSPIDGSGAQLIWLIGQPIAHDENHQTLIGVLVKDPEGIAVCLGSLEATDDLLPPAQTLGSLYMVPQGNNGPPVVLLEVPFDAAREVVRRGMALNWAAGNPLPAEYRFFSAFIWETGMPQPIAAPAVGDFTPAQTVALLDHPAFASWFWLTPEVQQAAEQLGEFHSLTARAAAVSRLAETCFSQTMVASYRRRLQGMAEWLMLAGEQQASTLAATAAAQLDSRPPSESPFLRRLISIGLDVAMAAAASRPNLRRVE